MPVTSNTSPIYPFQVLLPAQVTGLRADFKAQAERVRSVAFERIGRQTGRLTPGLLTELDDALRLHLGL